MHGLYDTLETFVGMSLRQVAVVMLNFTIVRRIYVSCVMVCPTFGRICCLWMTDVRNKRDTVSR
jgi:hypothetical protein